MAKVTVVISGGVVQGVYSDDQVELKIVDWDNESATNEDVEIDTAMVKTKNGVVVRVYDATVFKNEFMGIEEEEVIELEEIRYKKYLELQTNDNFDSLAVREALR